MNTTTNTPRVYVGTYAKYNDGSIAGEWIDLEGHDADSFRDACLELHKDEADPELMFQDFEGFPRE
ncbi:MAG TPA: antirestriction protein ArdA, partial [Kiritimatiellia bacterium]|nr:antirestriction protein ArdA [Kiritimatiellia bacterium]